MTAPSKPRARGLKDSEELELEAASSFCPFASVESFLVAKLSIGESMGTRESRDHCLPTAGSEPWSPGPASRVVDRTSYHDSSIKTVRTKERSSYVHIGGSSYVHCQWVGVESRACW